MGEEKIIRARITAKNKAEMDALLTREQIDFGCAGPRWGEDGTVVSEAYLPESQLERVRKVGLRIDVIDHDVLARERRPEVGRGNRFADGSVPQGLGRKVKGDGHGVP